MNHFQPANDSDSSPQIQIQKQAHSVPVTSECEATQEFYGLRN